MCNFQNIELVLQNIERGEKAKAVELLRSNSKCKICLKQKDKDGEYFICNCEMKADIETKNMIEKYFR